jgi:hypothetical protein
MLKIGLVMSQTKCCLTIIVLLLLSANMMAQIPNSGFENWSINNQPDNWLVRYTTASISTDKYAGNYALKLQTDIYAGHGDGYGTINSLPPNGTEGAQPAFPISARHTTLNGYYKFTPVNGDSCQFFVMLYKHGYVGSPDPQYPLIGVGALCKSASFTYAPFTVTINYFDSYTIPDSAWISLSAYKGWNFSTNMEYYPLGNSTLYVDNLSFDTFATSVSKDQTDEIPGKYELSQNYPNPFNPSTSISFNLLSKSFVSLKIFDLLGREVATVVSDNLSAGNHTQQWNANGMPSGVYFYRLQAGSFSETKKLVLLR